MPNRESAIGRFLCLLLKKYQINTARRRWKSYFLLSMQLYFIVFWRSNLFLTAFATSDRFLQFQSVQTLNFEQAICSLFCNKPDETLRLHVTFRFSVLNTFAKYSMVGLLMQCRNDATLYLKKSTLYHFGWRAMINDLLSLLK